MMHRRIMLNQKGIAFIPILIWAVAVLLTGTAVAQTGLITIDLNGNKSLVQKVDVIPSSFPVPIEALKTPTPQPVINQQPAIIQKTTPVIDPDPITTCNNPNCGPIKIPKSQCSDTVGYICCQIDTKWTWYASRSKCAQDQNTQNVNARRPNYVIPQVTTQTSTDPLVNCTLSFGTVQITQSDCELFKKNDAGPSNNTQTIPVPAPTLDPATKQYLDQDYQNYLKQQKKIDWEACIKKANEEKDRMLQWASTQNNITEIVSQQMQRNWGQALNQCNTLYGY